MRGLATILLLCISETATAADALPPGAMLRLGETRYRAGGEIRQLRFSDFNASATAVQSALEWP